MTTEKSEIRYKMKIKRKYFGPVLRQEADRAILEEFLNNFSKYSVFFIYNGFSTEARTDLIISSLIKQGKTVCLPRVEGENIVPVLYGKTQAGAFGVQEPLGKEYTGEIQVAVVPLLAVNERGYRIGYGKGYYDRYLSRSPALKVGLGYAFQMENFNGEEHDVPLDIYLCERGIYKFER